MKRNTLFRKIILALHLAIVAAYLLVCLVPFLSSDRFWFVSLLGLVFPLLFLLVLLFLIVWLILRKRWWWISAIALLLSWQQLSVVFAFHFFTPTFSLQKEPGSVRVFSWNVSRWGELGKTAQEGIDYRDAMMDRIRNQDADILCLQEFYEPYNSRHFKSNLEELAKMGYTYSHFYPTSVIWDGEAKFGLAILSRFPIVKSEDVSFGNSTHSEGLILSDINIGGKIIRLLVTHLESSRRGSTGSFNNEAGFGRATIRGLRDSYRLRTQQAARVKNQVAISPYHVILCGNLGDVPNSNTYFSVKGNLKDAFLLRGAGFGRTFRFISPTLRLDYFLADPRIRVLQWNVPDIDYSDHLPIMADVSLPN